MYRSYDFDDDSMDLDIYGSGDIPEAYSSSTYSRKRRSTDYGSSSSYGGGSSNKYRDYHSTSHLPQASNWWYDVGGPDLELHHYSDGYAALVSVIFIIIFYVQCFQMCPFQNAVRDQLSIYGGPLGYTYPYGSKRINYLKKYYNKHHYYY